MERKCLSRPTLSSIGSLFQARETATEKALCLNLRLVRGTMKSPRLDDRTEGLPGMSAAEVNRSLRYLGEL